MPYVQSQWASSISIALRHLSIWPPNRRQSLPFRLDDSLTLCNGTRHNKQERRWQKKNKNKKLNKKTNETEEDDDAEHQMNRLDYHYCYYIFNSYGNDSCAHGHCRTLITSHCSNSYFNSSSSLRCVHIYLYTTHISSAHSFAHSILFLILWRCLILHSSLPRLGLVILVLCVYLLLLLYMQRFIVRR